ncbi:MAG: LysR family transcriptional regulator, partial [Eggerthellaceae bacterium]|nr:LysR family transcriptional regulator [Eggerthellaceae bacterium]
MESPSRGRISVRLSYFEEFIELCNTLNFNAAAKALSMSQSSLTKHIQALENDLSVKLFERDKHSVTLTSQGEVFYD